MASTDPSPDAADRSEADASNPSDTNDPSGASDRSEGDEPADSERTSTVDAGADDGAHQSDGGRETVSLDGDTTLALPADATDEEAAAIAAAIAAHLQHRQRAAAAAAAAVANRQSVDHADRWTLAGRLEPQGKRVIPRDVERGDEWRAAARSFPR